MSAVATTRFSVVIPVGSRHADLAELYDEYRRGLDALGDPYETIFVVDGPQPDAVGRLRALCNQDDRITVLNLSRSFGEATALAAGLERASGEIIITLPAYYQIEASGIPSLVAALDTADMSIGRRWPLAASIQTRLSGPVIRYGYLRRYCKKCLSAASCN